LTEDCRDYARPDKVLSKHTAKHIEKASKFFPCEAEPVVSGDPDGGAPDVEVVPPVGFIPDISHDNRALWQWAGVNFGEFTCMLL